ncbi:MAG: glutamine amidotransferase [Kiritimatiellae bacterium]|nr:glutamine amidotransferase [Kiritimatiellia bacterium]
MRQKILLMALLAVSLAMSGASGGEPVLTQEESNEGGRRLVVIANDLYRLTFDPALGGRCTSFLIKATGREWVYDGKTGGLFQDHFAHQGYPGELLKSAYEYRIERDDDQSISICLWTIAKGGADGRDLLTKGLRVEKRITLRAGRRDVEVVNTFSNPTRESKNVGLWVQQCFNYAGDRLFDLYYRPSSHGISLTGRDDKGVAHYLPGLVDVYSQDWVGPSHYSDAGGRKVIVGWTAGRDRHSNEGAVFLIDYNYLQVLYNCGGRTTEWFMDKVPLPPGKSWSTGYTIIPVNGFTGFSHASRRLIANTEVMPEGGRVRIAHAFAGGCEPAGAITVSTRIYGVRSKKEASLAPLKVEGVGLEPMGVTQVWASAQSEPLVIRVAVEGQDWKEHYEYLFEGAFGGEGIQGAGQTAEYETPRPAKKKEFLKPDKWTRPGNKHLRVLLIYGLYSDQYRVEAAARALDPDAEVVVVEGWNFFPATHDDLLGYDLIVLSDMEVGPDYANVMVDDVVRFGGVGLLALGGIKTFGGGQWIQTALGELLPAEIRSPFDMKREQKGVRAKVSAKHPVVAGVEFPDKARFYWIHEMFPKAGSAVVMTAGERPLVITGTVGKGRVVVVAGTCHGEPGAGQVEAWQTPAWIKLLTQSLRWLQTGK